MKLTQALRAARAAADTAACERLLRQAALALAAWQADTAAVGEAPVLALQAFADPAWTPREQQLWAALQAPLQAALQAQPATARLADTPGRLMSAGRPLQAQTAGRGPAGLDLMALLRDPQLGAAWEEAEELDAAIRYWEAARRAGLGWSADFGDCWRQMEFGAVCQQLGTLAALATPGASLPPAEQALTLAWLVKAATRYRELAPLLPLLERRFPGATQQGYG